MKYFTLIQLFVPPQALRLSKTALGETAPGKVVNLVANDVNRFDLVSIFIHHMWSAPLSALIIAYFLYHEAGYAGVIGIIAVFIVVPVQGTVQGLIKVFLITTVVYLKFYLLFFIPAYTGKLSSKFRLQTAIKTDERVRLMDEIISGVQVIKMYAWEKPFCALVELARRLELKVVKKSSYIRGIYMTFNLFTTRMALYSTLVAMLLTGQGLSADKVFVFSSYFGILAHTMSGMFVRGFAEIAECMVAVKRLQNFLTFEEFQTGNVTNDWQLTKSNGTLNPDSRMNSAKTSRQDLPYIDEDVGLDERRNDKNRQSMVINVSDLLRSAEGDAKILNNVK